MKQSETRDKVEFGHFPVLDGLRGVAVLMVMIFHLEFLVPGLHPQVKGGFLGVDVFFVLSGFLITSILIKEYDKVGKISLRNFYLRRTLRLMPAFWLFLTFLYFAGNLLLPPIQAGFIYDESNFLYSFLYLMNWHKATGAITGNLNHTWSLAIEEQFYIIWSLILFKAFGEFRPRHQIAVGTAVVIGVLVIQRTARAASGTDINILYYSTDTRIDAILIGCLSSMVYCWKLLPSHFFRSRVFTYGAFASTICSIAILSIFEHEDRRLYFGIISLFSLSVAISILWLLTREKTVIHGLFELKLLRWLGEISYGLYLWHYAIYEFAKFHVEDVSLQVIVGVSLSLIVAGLSYYLVEQPILNLKGRFSQTGPNNLSFARNIT